MATPLFFFFPFVCLFRVKTCKFFERLLGLELVQEDLGDQVCQEG